MKKILFIIFVLLVAAAATYFIEVKETHEAERDATGNTSEFKLVVVSEDKPIIVSDKNSPLTHYYRTIFEPLVAAHGTELLPVLAADWQQTDTDVSVTLRQGITFSNGRDLTAQDVIYSLDYAKKNRLMKDDFFDLYTGVKVDGFKVIFSLKKPTPEFMNRLTELFVIEQKAAANENKLVGTGPLVADDATGAHARADYWGISPLLQKISLSVVSKTETKKTFDSLASGEIDGALLDTGKSDQKVIAGVVADKVDLNGTSLSLYLAAKGYVIETSSLWTLADIGKRVKEKYQVETEILLYKFLLKKYFGIVLNGV